MPTIYPASSVPAPVPNGTVFYSQDYNTGAGGTTLPTGAAFESGMTLPTAANLNYNFSQYMLATRYMSCYMVAEGLGISDGGGLTLNIAAGQALMDGIVELATADTIVLSDNATNYVWIQQAGTLVKRTDTAKPSGNCVFLGVAVTVSGSITSVDTSGVIYAQSGLAWRVTADIGAPTDSPDASIRLFTQTATGTWFWDGLHWVQVNPIVTRSGNSVPSGYTDYVGSTYAATIYPTLSVVGRLVVAGRIRVTA